MLFRSPDTDPAFAARAHTAPGLQSGNQASAEISEAFANSTANQTQADEISQLTREATLPIAKELLQLVQQQLHTLEHHHLVWMGQVWPGQEMQWEIQGKPEHPAQQPDDERQWSTEVELALPKLGNVHARLVFTENGLRLALQATDAVTLGLFNQALPQLKNSLAEADIALLAAEVGKK